MTPPPPPPTLGPIWDGMLTGLSWLTALGFLGMVLLMVLVRPVARTHGAAVEVLVTGRLGRVAAALGVLAVPAGLVDLARKLAVGRGYDLRGAWRALYDGTLDGALTGLQYTLMATAAVLVLAIAVRPAAACVGGLLVVSAALPALAVMTMGIPREAPDDWARTIFSSVMWVLHLWGGGIWVGGLIGLLALALPGGVPTGRRGPFWSRAIRRFSAMAMGSVAVILLSGLWLYWEHVDGPSQLLSTLYGRVLGVKILIFGTMTLLGALNQFWLHPRVERLRAAGDHRPLAVLLAREFPLVVAAEVVLGIGVLMVAPFLHGSARTEAYQREHPAIVDGAYERPPAKEVSGTTWAYGAAETALVIGVMAGGYAWSARLVRRRSADGARNP